MTFSTHHIGAPRQQVERMKEELATTEQQLRTKTSDHETQLLRLRTEVWLSSSPSLPLIYLLSLFLLLFPIPFDFKS